MVETADRGLKTGKYHSQSDTLKPRVRIFFERSQLIKFNTIRLVEKNIKLLYLFPN